MMRYELYCDRCGGVTTHETLQHSADDHVQTRTHPETDREVFCRSCERGTSKADLDGDTDFWVVADVEQGVGMSVHPDFVPEDETLEAHLERRLKEDYLGRLAAEIADGIREGNVSLKRVEREP